MATRKTSTKKAVKKAAPKRKPKLVEARKMTKVAQTKLGKKADKNRSALPAGVRKSKSGTIYTETRSNRAD